MKKHGLNTSYIINRLSCKIKAKKFDFCKLVRLLHKLTHLVITYFFARMPSNIHHVDDDNIIY